MGRRRKNRTDHEDELREEVVNAMRSQSPSERERRVITLWQQWETAKAFMAKVRSDCRTEVEANRSYLKEAMESTYAVGDEDAANKKLHRIEVCWQDLEEAKAKQRDGVGGAKDGVKGAFEKLCEAVTATQQLTMEFDRNTEPVRGTEADGDGEASNLDDESGDDEPEASEEE